MSIFLYQAHLLYVLLIVTCLDLYLLEKMTSDSLFIPSVHWLCLVLPHISPLSLTPARGIPSRSDSLVVNLGVGVGCRCDLPTYLPTYLTNANYL